MTAEYRIDLQATSQETRILEKQRTREGIEVVVVKGVETYPLTVTPSFGPEIVNPDLDSATSLAYGTKFPSPNPQAPYSLLVGLQANGRCGADCKGCVFANHRVGEAMAGSQTALARPVDLGTMSELIQQGKAIMREEGLITDKQTIRLNALLSGDPAFTPYVEELITMAITDPDISASRWSTIAADTTRNPLNAFVNAAAVHEQLSRRSSVVASHRLRFQVSLHSTDEGERTKHVSHYRNGRGVRLLSTGKIAEAFYCIRELTGYKPTLSFVLHGGSVIDPKRLQTEIPADLAMVCVRPIIPTDDDSTDPMPVDTFRTLYSDLRDRGYNVIVMPPIGLEMDNISAGQFHRSS